MKKLILLGVLFLVGCYNTAQTTEAVGNDFVVEKLFTHDGCTTYRFTDGGNKRYYTKCDRAQTTTSWSESCGKSCTRHYEIGTN